MKKIVFLFLFITIIFFINSCSKSGSGTTTTDPCAGTAYKFSTDVQPIINTTCAISSNCHNASSTNLGGPLTDYNKVFAKRADIKIQVQNGLMPQTGTITTDQKNKIICWINSGAPNN